MKMEKEFNLSEERRKIPQIVNITDAVAYHTGVKNALEIVNEQDKEFIKRLKEKCKYISEDEAFLLEQINKLAGDKLTGANE